MDIIPSVKIPCGENGAYRIERKEIKRDKFDILREAFNGGRYTPDGTYTFLYRGSTLVMSDTPDEKRDHYSAVRMATGNCLIAGLGIGMVLNAIAQKEEVKHIDVIELSKEVLSLVSPFYDSLYPSKITFHCASIFEWKPVKGTVYDMAWFDIWDTLCEDNLEEMATLHRKFGKCAKWKGSCGKEYLQYQRRRNNYRW